MLSKTYKINSANIATLKVKLDRLVKRANKLQANAISYSVGNRIEVKEQTRVYTFYEVVVTGEAPKLNSWTLAASIEHVGEDNIGNIIRAVPGFTVPESFRSANGNCEHCNKIRARKDTFIVVNTDGVLRQVGRQCIADFLGHANPHDVAGLAEIWYSIDEVCGAEENEGRGERARYQIELHSFLAATSCAMREYGWVSKAEAAKDENKLATASRALNILFPEPQVAYKTPKPTAEDSAEADKALEYVNTVIAAKDNKTEYEHNLSVLGKLGAIDFRATGLAASIVLVYRRAEGKRIETAKRASVSNYVGEVGKRDVYELTCTFVKEFETQYGVSKLHVFLDGNGNELTWWSTGKRLEVGKSYKLKATVKKHDTRNGVKQTVLTRCTEVENE